MKTSYLYQAVNLLSSMLVLMMVLGHLSPALYLQWALFQALAGSLVQLEQSLGTVMTRYLSRAVQTGRTTSMATALATAATAYRRFGTFGGLGLFIVGGVYLLSVSHGKFGPHWWTEWSIFCLGYVIYYRSLHFGWVLVAMHRAREFAVSAMSARIVHAGASALLLTLGFAIGGLSVSLLLSFAIGALAFSTQGKKAIVEWQSQAIPSAAVNDVRPFNIRHVLYHASFVFASYGLYRAGLLLSAGANTNIAAQASYALLLQIFALVMMVATVPLAIRVSPLVAAIESDEWRGAAVELNLLTAYVNLAFIAASVILIVLAGPLQTVLPSRGAVFPSSLNVAIVAAALFVELNIMVIVNALMAAHEYGFAGRYVGSSIIGLGMGTAAWWQGVPFYASLVALPALCQLLVALPAMLRLLEKRLGISGRQHLVGAVRHIGLIIRHPVSVGWAFR